MDIRLARAETAEDHTRVVQFVHEHFFPDMPLIRAFGLQHSPLPRSNTSHGDLCVMALDPRGGVVGVAINRSVPAQRGCTGDETPRRVGKEKEDLPQGHIHYLSDHNHIKKSKMMELVEVLEWVERDARLETLPEKTTELRVLAVHREWRRRGLARTLAEESVRQAYHSGYQAMRVCCTSEYTARLARSLGWRHHYCLRYEDYPSRAGVDIRLTPEPPHTSVYYYVTDLTPPKEDGWEFVFIEDYYA